MRIQSLKADETDTLQQTAELLVAGFARTAPDYLPNQEAALRELQDLLAQGFHLRVAIAEKGKVIGLIGGKSAYNGNVWELHPLVVHPDCQGQGIGRMLIADLEEIARHNRLLLDRGADVNGPGLDDIPLELAATHVQIAVMDLLVKRGATVNDFQDGGSYTLWRAAVENKLEAVKWLLMHEANPNTRYDGDTLLSAVGMFHQERIAVELRIKYPILGVSIRQTARGYLSQDNTPGRDCQSEKNIFASRFPLPPSSL